ncbi:MAG TPA: SurA N-terminal domain-containing protein [Thermodesulfobacteriota bacterium]|nr:SurA N-terminal domain-containing protein [Thermodesulfobacteriota bacterium]
MRKHAQSWLIKVALFLVAIVFVFWGVGSFRSDKASRIAQVNGKSISVNEYQQTFRQTLDRVKASLGQQPFDEKAFYTPEFKKRVLDGMIEKMLIQEFGKKMGFSVTSEELSRAIQQMPFFQDNGRFSFDKYKRLLQMNRMTPEVFENDQKTVLMEARVKAFLNELVKVTPEEAQNFYAYLNDESNDAVIFFKKEDYRKDISVTPEQVKTFFNQNTGKYRTPVQVKVTYLLFPEKDFEAKVTVNEKEIQEYYQQNAKKFTDPKSNKVSPIEQVKDRIETMVKEDKSRELALQKAEEMYDKVLSKGNLKTFGRESNAPVKETDWMTFGKKEAGLEGSSEFNQKAFALKKGELTPVVDLGPQWGFAILQVTDRQESQAMTLTQAESRAREDLIDEKAGQIALAEANAFIKTFQKSQDLQEAARKQSRKIEETGFFSRAKNMPPWAGTREIQESLFSLGVGHRIVDKPFIVGSDYGVAVFKESKPASLEEFKKDQQRFIEALQQQKQYALFEQWSRQLREKAKVRVNQDLL